ncbi:ATP-binding protein [Solicola sp. PLA-1-18]|uniref:ATP-binding protein n=1 Tax=Solicola sp. PLA-1-18 TaxID=3380532 RepID=UPI003B78F6CB
MRSPFTPGELPSVLAGRDQELERLRRDLGQVATFGRLAGRPSLFSAPRGIGKTSLLRTIQREAEQVGFVTAWVSAREDQPLVPELARAVAAGVVRAGLGAGEGLQRWRDRLASFKVELGVPGVRVGAEFHASGGSGPVDVTLEALVSDSSRLARDQGRAGLVVLIDELQAAASADLRTFAYAVQHLQGESRDAPAAWLGAGLPALPERLMEAATFAERFDYRTLARLTPTGTRDALEAPATAVGVRWQSDALDRAVRAAAGYPFMVQVLGDETWTASNGADGGILTVGHVERAEVSAIERMQPMFRGRWAKATAAERRFLAAMASVSEPVQRSAIADRLGQGTRGVSAARSSLIDKGLIEPSGHGRLSFTTPGFAEFVLAQPES